MQLSDVSPGDDLNLPGKQSVHAAEEDADALYVPAEHAPQTTSVPDHPVEQLLVVLPDATE